MWSRSLSALSCCCWSHRSELASSTVTIQVLVQSTHACCPEPWAKPQEMLRVLPTFLVCHQFLSVTGACGQLPAVSSAKNSRRHPGPYTGRAVELRPQPVTDRTEGQMPEIPGEGWSQYSASLGRQRSAAHSIVSPQFPAALSPRCPQQASTL